MLWWALRWKSLLYKQEFCFTNPPFVCSPFCFCVSRETKVLLGHQDNMDIGDLRWDCIFKRLWTTLLSNWSWNSTENATQIIVSQGYPVLYVGQLYIFSMFLKWVVLRLKYNFLHGKRKIFKKDKLSGWVVFIEFVHRNDF